MEMRYQHTMEVTACLLSQGLIVYSPIVHCHELAKVHGMPTDAQFWWRYDRAMLALASELRLLKLDGWQQSVGMRKEARFAIEREIPITYINYNEAMKL